MTEPIPTLSIGGKDYPVASLPPEVQNFLGIYALWEGELKTAKIEVFKLEAAIKGLSAEIEIRLKQYESTQQVS